MKIQTEAADINSSPVLSFSSVVKIKIHHMVALFIPSKRKPAQVPHVDDQKHSQRVV